MLCMLSKTAAALVCLVAVSCGAFPGTAGEPCVDGTICVNGHFCSAGVCAVATGAAEELEWLPTMVTPGLQMTRSEITAFQYQGCIDAGDCTAGAIRNQPDHETYDQCNYEREGFQEHPINCVSATAADEYCRWAGGRLPSESEWFTEASDSGTLTFPWGEQEATCDRVWMREGSTGFGCRTLSTGPVCSKRAGDSVRGLCDMSGNVAEWTSTVDPGGRVVLGGHYLTDHSNGLKASSRELFTDTLNLSFIGFRCARDISAQ